MKPTNDGRRFALQALLAPALAAVAPLAWSQAFPNRPIRLVVGFRPRAASDVAARVIAQQMRGHRRGQRLQGRRLRLT
jgi:tripartite-type tricarboxylate transporter receptor subunit TctC